MDTNNSVSIIEGKNVYAQRLGVYVTPSVLERGPYQFQGARRGEHMLLCGIAGTLALLRDGQSQAAHAAAA